MENRTFENLGAEASLLGFGCMRFPTVDGKIDEAESERMLDRAMQAGVNYYDTAYPYHDGDSEPFVGKALKKYDRSSFYLATKLPIWKLDTITDVEKIFNVSPANFIPPPKVTSSVIRMNIHKTPPVSCENEENLFRVIRGAFAKRRKTLSNSLSGETNRHTKAEIEAVLVSLGYRADVRGETLGLPDFAKISDALEL